MQMTVLTPRICALVPHSTRPFWHQWESSTQQQQPQPEQQQEQPKKSARRRLFQQEDSADEETNKQYVKRLLNDLSERYKQKWNFDFENDKPMEGQYQYDALPARQVPGFYRMVQHFDQPQSPARPKNFFGSATAEQQQQQPSAERNENHWSPLLEQQAGNSSDLGDQPMEASESKLTESALKSPSRVLRKARRSMQTPNKRNGQQAEDRGRGSHGWPAERQTKLTDFMSTRKGLARSVSKEFKEPQQQPMAVADSPTKRRRHSTLDNGSRSPSRLFSSVDSPIKKGGQTRRSPRLHHARSALFK